MGIKDVGKCYRMIRLPIYIALYHRVEFFYMWRGIQNVCSNWFSY